MTVAQKCLHDHGMVCVCCNRVYGVGCTFRDSIGVWSIGGAVVGCVHCVLGGM